jgi:lysozyme family protein
MRTVDQIIDDVINREQGYVNNPKDRGGPTNWGITERVARDAGYKGDMKDLPRATAHAILKDRYHIAPGFNRVAKLSNPLAEVLTDAGVLCGQATAAKWLQRLLNVFNREGKSYPDIIADGLIGGATIAALGEYLDSRQKDGEKVLIRGINCLLGAHFISISESRTANEEFTFGWILNRVTIN